MKSYLHGPVVDEVLYQEDYSKGETLFFHQDNLLSTVALSNESGSLKESFAYDPFGNLIKAPLLPKTRFLYTGRELDFETNLYYSRNRYYDPRLGRFLSPDPTGYQDGLNLYSYAQNNPLILRDPQGLSSEVRDPYWGGGKKGKGGGLKGFFGILLGIAAAVVAGPVIGAAAGFIGGAIGGAVGAAAGAVAGAAVGSGVAAATTAVVGAAAFAAGAAVVSTAAANIVQGAPVFRGVGRATSIAAITAGALKVAGWVGRGIQNLATRGTPFRFLGRLETSQQTLGRENVPFSRGIQQAVRNNFFRPENEGYVVGKEGRVFSGLKFSTFFGIFEPGKPPMSLLEDYVPTMHRFGVVHDNTVSTLIHAGVPDSIANIPTMPAAYLAGLVVTGFNASQDIIEGIGNAVAR